MRQIDLVEYEKSEPQPLSASELDALLREAGSLDLSIAPVTGESGMYNLTPGSTVGAVEMGGLSVLIRPKIGIQHLLSLACYAISKIKFQIDDFGFPDEYALPDALALALASHARRAFARGLLHGYRTEEEALHTVRGRIRFDEQIRRRFGAPLPRRGALRRVHRRHPGEPAGQGRGCSARRDASALAAGAQGSGVDCGYARQRLAGQVSRPTVCRTWRSTG